MRLTKLRIKGYRSIKSDEILVTDDRVTILIGANDHGKSNLLAAIQCLNDDHPIDEDDRNWDLEKSDPVEIKWHFAATDGTLARLRKFGPPPPPVDSEPMAKPEAATQGAEVVKDLTAPTLDEPFAAQTTDAASTPEPEPIKKPYVPPPTFPVGTGNEIVFSRDFKTNEVRIVSLPVPVLREQEKEVLALRPRVELFESPTGNVVDQVNLAQLETPAFEFMQGIFRLAGLWDSRATIFVQNDTTSRKLDEASVTLTKVLNDQWNQGKELKWKFEHTGTNGDTIVIKIQDPAIKGRFTRPSLRSSGFRTYFLLSMIVYARSQNTPGNSHIYLFDEPGTYLHPSAQLDLQRSLRDNPDQAQLAYTTHSLFLISKNYPSRNRVISKTINGTKIDQKPFSKNWKSVRQSLGILLSNNFLIADKTLLVEGPSDTIYLLDALKRLKAAGTIDVDLNDMSIVDAGDGQNFVAMAKIMLSEGRSVVALTDGDKGGKALQGQLEKSCAAELTAKTLRIHSLPDNKSSEDIFANLTSLRRAVRASCDVLVADGSRVFKEDANVDAAIAEIVAVNGTTLGKTMEKVTAALFAPAVKVSKLLIAIHYEDAAEAEKAVPPEIALVELEKIRNLLELRSEKSKQSGVFEEVEA